MPLTAAALVLLSCGAGEPIAALQDAAAAPLAALLQRPLEPGLLGLDGGSHPQQALAALPAGCLAPLPCDPGMPLDAAHGHWAEQLGAARQCCLLLVDAEQLHSGVAAATTALLQQWQVPLLGLVQWGEPWNAAARRRDGLPWLGWLDGSSVATQGDNAATLRLACTLRWQQLLAALQ